MMLSMVLAALPFVRIGTYVVELKLFERQIIKCSHFLAPHHSKTLVMLAI